MMRKRKAIALYLSYVVILSLLIFGGITIVRGINSLNFARRSRSTQQALYLSEAAIRAVGYNLSQAIANFEDETTNSVLADTARDVATLPYWAPPSDFYPADLPLLTPAV